MTNRYLFAKEVAELPGIPTTRKRGNDYAGL